MKKYAWITICGVMAVACVSIMLLYNQQDDKNTKEKACTETDSIIIDEPAPEESNVSYGGDWYKPSVNGPSFKMFDKTIQTKWMQMYAAFIKELAEEEFFDYTEFYLTDADEDGTPEVILSGGCHATASMMLTIYDNKVYSSPKVYFYSYIKGGKGLLQWHDRQGDCHGGGVYEMNKGKFIELFRYVFQEDVTDTKPIEKRLDEVYFSKGTSLRMWNDNTEWYPIDFIL